MMYIHIYIYKIYEGADACREQLTQKRFHSEIIDFLTCLSHLQRVDSPTSCRSYDKMCEIITLLPPPTGTCMGSFILNDIVKIWKTRQESSIPWKTARDWPDLPYN